MQLCAQVQQTLSMLIDEVCCDCAASVSIGRVIPAPHASHLMVFVQVADAEDESDLERVRHLVESKSGYMRSEVAQSIHRRKAPNLSFLCVPNS
ncbi:MAG: ribosome-binding factor A [Pirellula sp.]